MNVKFNSKIELCDILMNNNLCNFECDKCLINYSSEFNLFGNIEYKQKEIKIKEIDMKVYEHNWGGYNFYFSKESIESENLYIGFYFKEDGSLYKIDRNSEYGRECIKYYEYCNPKIKVKKIAFFTNENKMYYWYIDANKPTGFMPDDLSDLINKYIAQKGSYARTAIFEIDRNSIQLLKLYNEKGEIVND